MGWTFAKNLTGLASRKTLPAAVIVLAAIVLLLWFGAIRSVVAVFADSIRSDTECSQPTFEECEEVISSVRPLGQSTYGGTGYAYAEQEAVGSGLPGIPTLGNSGGADDLLNFQLIPIACLVDHVSVGYSHFGENAAGSAVPGIPTFGSVGQGFGEPAVESRCFRGIPCWQSEGGMIGEQAEEGSAIGSTPLLENRGLAYW